MVTKMTHVILHQPFERHSLTTADDASRVGLRVGHELNNPCHKAIERQPKAEQLGPRLVAIAVHANPFVLLVAWPLEGIHHLRSHETLVVVGGGVDQVSEKLFPAPLPASAASGHAGL